MRVSAAQRTGADLFACLDGQVPLAEGLARSVYSEALAGQIDPLCLEIGVCSILRWLQLFADLLLYPFEVDT